MFQIDAEAFKRDLKRMAEDVVHEVHLAQSRTTAAAATWAKLSKLYHSHTYGLRNSIKEGHGSEWETNISANAPYASYVENGTVAHEIVPRNKKALRFTQGGDVVFAMRVYHPGTKPRPFMQEARDKAEPLFDRLAREAVDRAFK